MRKRLITALAALAVAAGAVTWFAVDRARRQGRIAQAAAERAQRDAEDAARVAAEAEAAEESERRERELREARAASEEAARLEREREAAAPGIERAEREAAGMQARECAVDAFREGVDLDRSMDGPAASAAYMRALEADGSMAGAWTNLAILLDRSGRHEDAAVAAGMAIGLPASADPRRRARALHALAHAQAGAGRPLDALDSLGRALEADPCHAPSALAAARLWSDRGDDARAVAVLSAAHDAGCADAAIESFLAVLHWRRGDIEASASHAEAAIRLDPGDGDARTVLAHARLARGRWAEAASGLEAGLRARPDDADLHAALAYAYERMGRGPDAVREYDRAVALDPAHATAHAHRGAMLEAAGRVEDARAAYRRADASAPSKARSAAQTKLAVAEFLAGNIDAARGLAQRAVESDAANAHARFVLGVAALRTGDRNTAAAQQQALAGSDPERAEELGKLLAGGPG